MKSCGSAWCGYLVKLLLGDGCYETILYHTPPWASQQFSFDNALPRVVLKGGGWINPWRCMVNPQALALCCGMRSPSNLPFQTLLGPIADPDTGLPLVGAFLLTSEMAATVTLELTSLGFLAYLSATFPWTDASGVTHQFTIPSFPVVKPPSPPTRC